MKAEQCVNMNNEIVTLHRRETLNDIKMFEKMQIKRAHNIANMSFLKKCKIMMTFHLFLLLNNTFILGKMKMYSES
jgi:hypothetical protein